MKKQQFLVLALAFMLLGAALLVATVAASHTFSNVLLIPQAQKQALLARGQGPGGLSATLFRYNYWLILLGLALAGLGFYLLSLFNRHSRLY